MATPAAIFDAHITNWLREQEQPWMRLRYRIGQTNLARHLLAGPLRVLDIGGGNGADALPLAALGHQVTIADYSAAMLAEAKRLVSAAGLSDLVTLVQTDIAGLPNHLPAADFDLVLCHNVVQYLDDAAGALQVVSGRLAPGGILSLITINPASELLRAALQRLDLSAALAALDATSAHALLFDVMVRRYSTDQLQGWLAAAGCSVIAHYGIRCINDYIADNERKYEPHFIADLERLELALSNRDPYRQIARFTHLVARRHQ